MKPGLRDGNLLFCVPQRTDGIRGYGSMDKQERTIWVSSRIQGQAYHIVGGLLASRTLEVTAQTATFPHTVCKQ